LRELNAALFSFLRQQAIQQVATRGIQAWLYTGLVAALTLPMALTTTINVTIGSRWRVALRRSKLAGRRLAHVLAAGGAAGRPVTLVGAAMGARLCFHCLLELERLGCRGVVEHCVLLGTPVSARVERWAQARRAVAGRLISGFSVNDATLALVYRLHSPSAAATAAAGSWRVGVRGVEDVNVSAIVRAHADWGEEWALEEIFDALVLH